MKDIIAVSLLAYLAIGQLSASEDVSLGSEKEYNVHSIRKAVDAVGKIEEKDVSMVDSFRRMFTQGKVSGQVRAMYDGYNQEAMGVDDAYSTAIGGILKYELAEFKGFNAGVAVYASHNLPFATGSETRQIDELSSVSGSYTEMAEAYVNYKYEDFNFRAGRQVLDTPLADSDDRSMIQNTFNAYVLSYSNSGFEFMVGNIQSWQGVDAGLDEPWLDTGSNGTNFGGVSYNDGLELGAWYYNVTNQTNAAYLELGGNYELNKNMNLHAMAQYLDEKELSGSAIAADIYGAMVEFVAYDLGFGFAYNKSDKKAGRNSFSGFGGGTLFTSMDTMILDEIANDRDAASYVANVNYSFDNFGFLYAYGDFDGNKNGADEKAHVVEQDVSVEYNVNDEFLVSAIYVISQDKESVPKTGYDWQRAEIIVNYNF